MQESAMAAAAIGWYGPLVDLCKAPSHVGDFVQLLVFVHKSTPVQARTPEKKTDVIFAYVIKWARIFSFQICSKFLMIHFQYKLSRNGGEDVIRMDIQVGDETRHCFPVSIWQKQLGSTVATGDIVLLQNVKIARFRDVIEARTLQCSLVQCLVRSKELLVSKGVDELIRGCRIGMIAKNKLQKVTKWVKRAGLTNFDVEYSSYQTNKPFLINWKTNEEVRSWEGFSLIQLKHLPNASKATFHAYVGEIFLPITWRHLPESEAEKMFISRRIYTRLGDDNLADDLISIGCQLCGTPMSSEVVSSIEKKNFPLCQKSCNGLHVINMIYRPFQLYVWDDSQYIPLLVKNKAAEMLFGNIEAEKVYASYQREYRQNVNGVSYRENHSRQISTSSSHACEHRMADSRKDDSGRLEKHQDKIEENYHSIFLVLLKLLFKQGKNSPLNFTGIVNSVPDCESVRYEVLSVSMSSSGTKGSYRSF